MPNQSIYLDDETLDIAYTKCEKGELSSYIRELIKNDNHKQYTENQHEKKETILETFFFLILGITFLGLAVGTIVDVLLAINTILLVISSIFLFMFVCWKIKKYHKICKEV